jgi:hypothetical protein
MFFPFCALQSSNYSAQNLHFVKTNWLVKFGKFERMFDKLHGMENPIPSMLDLDFLVPNFSSEIVMLGLRLCAGVNGNTVLAG